MSNLVIGVEISVPGIEVAVVDADTKAILPGTFVFKEVNTHESAENLINAWTEVIQAVISSMGQGIPKLGMAITGPFDYENGISLMHNHNKFEALYQLNVKDMLAAALGLSPLNIRMKNNAPCFAKAEVLVGAAQGYDNVLAFTLNQGLGSAHYFHGVVEDARLSAKGFKDGTVEDYIGIGWLIKRYKEFTGVQASGIAELSELAKNDDGIGQLVFNEYGENFVKFLLQYMPDYNPEALLFGGHNYAWELFVDHLRDRLSDKEIKIPILSATLGNTATLIGAADLWK